MIDLMDKGKEEVGDAEACLYLFTLALTVPLGHELGQVYIYLSSKMCKRKQIELMPFMEEKVKAGLTSDEERELRILKQDLWRKRGGKIKSPIFEILNQLKKTNRVKQ